MKKTHKIVLVLSVICAALLVWGVVFSGSAPRVSAQKEDNSTTANMSGDFVYGAFGTISAQNPVGFPPGSYNSTAKLVHDGDGNYTVTAKTSYNGVIVDEEFSGTYTVDEGCRVTYFYQGAPAVYAIFTGNRKEARGISTIPGTNISYLTVRN